MGGRPSRAAAIPAISAGPIQRRSFIVIHESGTFPFELDSMNHSLIVHRRIPFRGGQYFIESLPNYAKERGQILRENISGHAIKLAFTDPD